MIATTTTIHIKPIQKRTCVDISRVHTRQHIKCVERRTLLSFIKTMPWFDSVAHSLGMPYAIQRVFVLGAKIFQVKVSLHYFISHRFGFLACIECESRFELHSHSDSRQQNKNAHILWAHRAGTYTAFLSIGDCTLFFGSKQCDISLVTFTSLITFRKWRKQIPKSTINSMWFSLS